MRTASEIEVDSTIETHLVVTPARNEAENLWRRRYCKACLPEVVITIVSFPPRKPGAPASLRRPCRPAPSTQREVR